MSPLKRRNFFIILMLGALSTIGPFAIDMYLAAFPQIAADLHTTPEKISLSLSSYFIGLSIGQLFYGPLLDRFGRKKPLYFGMVMFMLASVGCMQAHSVEMLIVFRFLQAFGGCAAQVASRAMVRDFFHVKESAKVFSLLMLVVGVSPLFAPTVGSLIAVSFGWQWVFILLASIALVMLVVMFFFLPEAHVPDKTISLRPLPIIRTFWAVLWQPQFATYAFAGSFAFAGLLVYVAGAPLIFMQGFHVSPHMFGGIFATLAMGFIGGNQVNIMLTKRFQNAHIFHYAVMAQCVIGLVLLVGSAQGWYGLWVTLVLLFCYLSTLGLSTPNAAALALAPFSKNVGTASALLGFLQIGIAALASSGVGLIGNHGSLPAMVIMLATGVVGLVIYSFGRRRFHHHALDHDAAAAPLAH